VTVLTVAYTLRLIVGESGRLKTDFADPRFLLLIGLGAVLYCCLGMVLAIAWHRLISAFGPPLLPFRLNASIYGQSQILKYVPTNVFHVVRRHAQTRVHGTSHLALVWATLLEGLLTVAAAAGLTLLFAAPLFAKLTDLASEHGAVLAVLGLGAVATVILLLILSRRLLRDYSQAWPSVIKAAVLALVLYGLFFLANGLIFSVLAGGSAGLHAGQIPAIVGIVAAAWVAGFLTPGASGGVGVREVVLITGLNLAGFGPAAVSIAVAYRLVTLGGDIIFAAAATLASLTSGKTRV
jgi:hypothetical protein